MVMEKETLKNIFKFLEEGGEHRAPVNWKLENNIPITEKDDLIVDGHLYLPDSEIKSLPKGLEVGGHLYLYDSKIESLPEGLKVRWDLTLNYCKNLTSLPKGLQVGSNLYIVNTPLTKYSDDELREMVKPGFIKKKIFRGK